MGYKRDISTQASQGGFNACVITCKQLHLLLGQGWPSQGVIWNRIEGEKIGKCPPSLWHFAICVIITAQLQIFDQLINQWVHLKNNETFLGENDKIHMCYELNKYEEVSYESK